MSARQLPPTPSFLHFNSVERAQALVDWVTVLGNENDSEIGPMFWRLAEQEWPGFDAIDHHDYAFLFERFRPYRQAPQCDLYKSLP